MGIIKRLEDVMFITPWIVSVLCVLIMIIPVYLFLLFSSYLIFIYERLKEYYYDKN